MERVEGLKSEPRAEHLGEAIGTELKKMLDNFTKGSPFEDDAKRERIHQLLDALLYLKRQKSKNFSALSKSLGENIQSLEEEMGSRSDEAKKKTLSRVLERLKSTREIIEQKNNLFLR